MCAQVKAIALSLAYPLIDKGKRQNETLAMFPCVLSSTRQRVQRSRAPAGD